MIGGASPHRLDKIEALQRLANGLVHELNNLFTGIRGNLQFIESQHISRDQMLEIVSDVQRAVSRGIELSRKLQAYSGRQDLCPEHFDLEDLVGRAFESSVPDNIQVRDLPATHHEVFLDRGKLYATLTELVVNACSAMPTGGALSFAVDVLGCDKIRLMITDTGHGMAPEVMERAEDPLFTTTPYTRSGWGLSLAGAFLRQSGGELTFSRADTGGLCVAITLPLQADHAPGRTG